MTRSLALSVLLASIASVVAFVPYRTLGMGRTFRQASSPCSLVKLRSFWGFVLPHAREARGRGAISGQAGQCLGTNIKSERRGARGEGTILESWRLPKDIGNYQTDTNAEGIDRDMLARFGIRLASVASMVPLASRVADIGCDHGHLSIGLVNSGRASIVIASEKNKLPLSQARDNIAEEGGHPADCIELRHGDGLSVLSPGEVDTACVCGMGGPLIAKILFGSAHQTDDDIPLPERAGQGPREAVGDGGKRLRDLGITKLVMQPTGPIAPLRHALYSNGWSIDGEALTCDGRWAHVVISAAVVSGNAGLRVLESDEDVLLGPFLKHERSQVYKLWIEHQIRYQQLKLQGALLQEAKGEGTQAAQVRARRCLEVLEGALGRAS